MGYTGGFSLEDLMLDTNWKTIFTKDDGSYGAVNSAVNVGIVDGTASPEDALGLLWINTSIQFKGNVKTKVRKPPAGRKLKFVGEPWGQNLNKNKT